jgi:tetratricopeptide (TPR) repeat protein
VNSANWNIGDLIQERWEVRRILQGGMGIVYIVYDRKGREVFAAKTFQDEVFAQNPNTGERFRQEALAWINLDRHESITEASTLHIIGGKPFLFLEYVSGGDLGRWIGMPSLIEDMPQVLRFGIQFCDGMRHVISKGIKAHRDIKPQNCLITSSGTLKITDFGLAKVFDDVIPFRDADSPAGRLSVAHSQTGTAAGTCTHMSPEQFADSKGVDVRADIYSFGVMLFQMVTGELPFVGRNFMEFAALHIKSTPPIHKISNHRIRSVIEKCLRKNPKDRYQNFDALRRDLASLYEGETGLRVPTPVVGDELTAYHLVNKGKGLGDLGMTDDSLECFDKAIAMNPTLAEAWLNKGASLSEKGQNAEAMRCFDRALAINPKLSVAWSNKGHVLFELGHYAESLTSFQRALQLNPRDAGVLFHEAATFAKLGKHEEAVASYTKVVRLEPKRSNAWFNMAHSMGFLGRHQDVIKCCDHALQIHPDFTPLWIMKGLGSISIEHFRDALDCFQHADKLGDTSAADHIARCRMAHAEWYFRLGSVYQQEGNNVEAANCYEKGLAINPNNAIIWSNKGAALLALKRGAEAVACFDRAIALNPSDASAWNNKGCALLSMNQQSEALACLQEAKRLRT